MPKPMKTNAKSIIKGGNVEKALVFIGFDIYFVQIPWFLQR